MCVGVVLDIMSNAVGRMRYGEGTNFFVCVCAHYELIVYPILAC